MDLQKEALCRIISTLANKKEEVELFLVAVDNTLTALQEESCHVLSELEAELALLRSALDEKGAELHNIIKEETQKKEAELQAQRSEGKLALRSCDQLLAFSSQTLSISSEEEFLTAAKQIKQRVTMAPAFRLSLRPAVSGTMSQFSVDFSGQRAELQQLHFLPVPAAPLIDATRCVVRDNGVTVFWRPTGDVSGADGGSSGPIESYELQYRQTDCGGPLAAAAEECWEKLCDIRDTRATISGLKFDSKFVVVRVRARNKAAAGDFSEPVSMETRAFHFRLDASTAHSELKVDGDTVTWEPQGVKGHDARLRGKESKSCRSNTPSPNKTSAGRTGRFAGDSYTVLGDQEMIGGCHYWELRPLADWKSFSVGVAYRGSLGRFDQLGKSACSWCLHASQWLQSSLSAKHNNRAKTLDGPLPHRVGIYCHHGNGDLLFIDVDRLRLLHFFKTKFSSPLVPAFTVWGGGIVIATGLQVPSFIGNFLSTNQSPGHLSTNQSPDHLSTNQSPDHLSTNQSPDHLPTNQSPDHLPTNQSPGHLPTNQSPGHLPTNQSPGHLSPNQSPGHLPTNQSPGHLPTNQSPGHLSQ